MNDEEFQTLQNSSDSTDSIPGKSEVECRARTFRKYNQNNLYLKLYLLNESWFLSLPLILPLRFRKTGIVMCDGARETHWATCHNLAVVTPSWKKEFLKSPCFLDLMVVKVNNSCLCRVFLFASPTKRLENNQAKKRIH